MITLNSNICFSFIISILFFILIFLGIKRKDESCVDIFNRDNTSALKGICALIVMFHHFSQHLIYGGDPIHVIYLYHRFGGHISVGMFLFISGYVLTKKFLTDKNYSDAYIPKRLLRLYIPFAFCVIFQYAGTNVPLDKVFWGIITFRYYSSATQLYDPCWFMICIVYLSLALYVAWSISHKHVGLLLFLFSIAYITVCLYSHLGGFWYDTVLCIPLGCTYCRCNMNGKFFFEQKRPLLILCFLIFIISFIAIIHYGCIIYLQIVCSIGFVSFVFLSLEYVKFQSKFLNLIGGFSLEIFLVHSAVYNKFYTTFDTRNQFTIAIVISLSLLVAYVVHLASAATTKYTNLFLQ